MRYSIAVVLLLASSIAIALLEQPIVALVRHVAAGVRRLCGPTRSREHRALADLLLVAASWLIERARRVAHAHRLSVGRVVGGIALTALFVAAGALEVALVRIAAQVILPLGDPIPLFGLVIDPALGVALAILMLEAATSLVTLEAAGVTDMFAWDSDWSQKRRHVVAVAGLILLLAFIVIQGALAFLRSGAESAATSDPSAVAMAGAAPGFGVDTGGALGRAVTVALSALVPIVSTAGALGAHTVLLTLAAALFATASALAGALHLAASWTSIGAEWGAELAVHLLHVIIRPARWVFDVLSKVVRFTRWGR